ncbi:MAG: hypothetical protein ABR540_20015 [Acidimicrobiales bacterium]|nr:hypothetical protein [Actinomycetota bacterium]
MRPILAVGAAAVVGALGAVVLGEYTFSGLPILVSGPVLGFFMAEAALAVAGARAPRAVLAGGCAVLALAAMVWSAWISSGHDLSFLPGEGWVAVGLAAVAAGLRAGWTRPAAGSPRREPEPEG